MYIYIYIYTDTPNMLSEHLKHVVRTPRRYCSNTWKILFQEPEQWRALCGPVIDSAALRPCVEVLALVRTHALIAVHLVFFYSYIYIYMYNI